MPDPIIIRFSYGDAHYLWQCIQHAARNRSWEVVRKGLWVMRETRRQGAWKPYTIGDAITLRRLRRWAATPGGTRPYWRHGDTGSSASKARP